MGFDVVHCCYYDKIYLQLIDMGGLRLQRAIETDTYSNGSRCKILIASVCKNKRNKAYQVCNSSDFSLNKGKRFESKI